MIFKFTDDQIVFIADNCAPEELLGDLSEVAIYIGVHNAIKLALRLGGAPVYLRKWHETPKPWGYGISQFIEVIGIENAEKVVRLFGGNYIDIPKCDALFLKWRNELILRAKVTKTYAVTAREFGLSRRQVIRIIMASKGCHLHVS
ncbi:MAG: Mor transcription activator family protein [Mariprofundaceae bacterium]